MATFAKIIHWRMHRTKLSLRTFWYKVSANKIKKTGVVRSMTHPWLDKKRVRWSLVSGSAWSALWWSSSECRVTRCRVWYMVPDIWHCSSRYRVYLIRPPAFKYFQQICRDFRKGEKVTSRQRRNQQNKELQGEDVKQLFKGQCTILLKNSVCSKTSFKELIHCFRKCVKNLLKREYKKLRASFKEKEKES